MLPKFCKPAAQPPANPIEAVNFTPHAVRKIDLDGPVYGHDDDG
jgi:hypothetical protein